MKLVKVRLRGSAVIEAVWAIHLHDEVYEIDNHPINPEWNLGDIIIAERDYFGKHTEYHSRRGRYKLKIK